MALDDRKNIPVTITFAIYIYIYIYVYIYVYIYIQLFSLVAQKVKTACNVGDLGLIPGSGRSPEEGNSNPLQYSCLENSTDRGV